MTEPPQAAPAAPESAKPSELEFISELCTVVAENSELQPILDWIVHKTTRLLGADECNIKLLTAGGSTAQTIIFDNRRSGIEAGAKSWSGAVKASVMGYLLVQNAEIASPDVTSDTRFPGLRGQASGVRALLAVPLRVDGRITGMLAVSNTQPGREWARPDVQMLSIVASHSAGVIEKARLRTEAEQKRRLELEKEKLEKELLLARDIQMRLVPDQPLDAGPWRVDGRVIPARQVGGDYFDFFALDANRVAIVIADVAGKGVPAALLVSTVQGTLRAFSDGRLAPSALMPHMNRAVVRSSAAGKFVTLFYAELDHVERSLRFVNAGHNYPILRRADGSIEMLQTGGLPLGLFDDAEYAEGRCAFAPGDALLLYSDGISEAVDVFKNEFGEERLLELWKGCASEAPRASLARIMDAVSEFRGSEAQSDDMTAVVVAPPEA